MRKVCLPTLLLIVLAAGCQSKTPAGPAIVTITESTLPPPAPVVPIPTVSKFLFSPQTPEVLQAVNFDGTDSVPPPGRTIVRYEWDFGDGTSGQGVKTTHAYAVSGTYLATLTVTDSEGQQGRSSEPITVRPAAASTTAAFVFSPASPALLEPVSFNAAASSTAPGRTIVTYAWDFGDGSVGTGERPTHAYTRAGTFIVTLVVTDSLGQKGTASQPITVRP